MVTQALVNPEVINWARVRSGLSEDLLARKTGVSADKVIAWESGQKKPTFKQAQNIARVTNTPFGYLFLSSIPAEKLPIPDLRTVGGVELDQPSTELRDVLKQVMQQQDWYKEYLLTHGEDPLPFVGAFDIKSDVAEVVASIRETIGVGLPERGSWSDYFTTLVQGAESARILVMRSGKVGSNTHRKLQVSEFRGFAISDKYAPVVFINSADAPAARLFTLLHELAHIWLGCSGISDVADHGAKTEVFCNAVAGEFLVPEKSFIRLWNENLSIEQNAENIAATFHVSKFVIVRRALDCSFISRDQYATYYNAQLQSFRDSGGGGGDFYRTAKAQNSSVLSAAVVTEALSGRMLLRDAGKLLGVAPNHIRTYARKLTV